MNKRESKTQYAILGMLSFGAKSGYEISKAIKNSTEFFWTESDGQLYPILRKLAEEELVNVTEIDNNKRSKKIYKITSAGKKALLNWLQQTPTTFNTRNEFLLQLFFGHNLKSKENLEKIKSYQYKLKEQLSLYNLIEQQIQEKSKYPTYLLMTLSYGQYVINAEIAWCEATIKNWEKKNV